MQEVTRKLLSADVNFNYTKTAAQRLSEAIRIVLLGPVIFVTAILVMVLQPTDW